MAPRKPKPTDDDVASVTSNGTDPLPVVLKPKTEKAKVSKPKTAKKEKIVVDGIENEKPKAKAVKKEKLVTEDGEKVKKSDGGKGDGVGKDGKEKIKPVTGEEAVQVLLSYLKKENRPYSVTDIFMNLHGKVCSPVSDEGRKG